MKSVTSIDAEKHLNSISIMKSLKEKLVEKYFEELSKTPSIESLNEGSGLLNKLIEGEQPNTLIVNLYPNNEGYSLMLRNASRLEEVETIRLAYEESDILEYIDRELIPPVIIDLLDRVQNNLFYSGNIIAELRDYRHLTDNLFETHYVLLKSSDHTLLCDLNSMTSEIKTWPIGDKLKLESEMLLHTSDLLCLDPSPSVFKIGVRASQYKTLQRNCLRRTIKRCSQVSLNRQKRLKSHPDSFTAYKCIKRHHGAETKNRSKPNDGPSRIRNSKGSFSTDNDIVKLAQVVSQQKVGDNGLAFVEEFVFEADRGNGKTNLSRLTISQRPSEESYFGSLYVDRDYRDGESQGSSCRFNLGSYCNVEKYIRQFKEIFTEEGRRQVKITHQVGSQAPQITFTQGDSGKMASSSSSMGLRLGDSNDGRHVNASFAEEFSGQSRPIEVDSKPSSTVLVMNSDPKHTMLPKCPTPSSQTSWSETLVSPSNQVASLFPIKLLPPATLANMTPQLSQLFSPGHVNTSHLQINTSQLSCPSMFLSHPLDSVQNHGSIPSFIQTKPSIHPQSSVQTFLSPSSSFQQGSILKLPSQLVSQLQQQNRAGTGQHLRQQPQQQMQQQRISQINVPSSLAKDAKLK